jgi:hypothetical protein
MNFLYRFHLSQSLLIRNERNTLVCCYFVMFCCCLDKIKKSIGRQIVNFGRMHTAGCIPQTSTNNANICLLALILPSSNSTLYQTPIRKENCTSTNCTLQSQSTQISSKLSSWDWSSKSITSTMHSGGIVWSCSWQ